MSLCCPYMRYKKGTRTYSAYVPSYAQGAYFPEDEPGEYCKLNDEPCPNVDGTCPYECPIQEDTTELCDECQVNLKYNSGGQTYCPECLEIYESEY